METFSALLALSAGNSPVTGEFPAQRPVTRSFDVFFDMRLNKRLSKESWGWWFETPSCSLWRQCNVESWAHKPFKISVLTHWGRVTHICVVDLTIIGSDNGLSPGRRRAIIWTNAGILLIGPLGTNFSEILIEVQTFSLKKIRLKMWSAKCCSFRLGLNMLTLAEVLWPRFGIFARTTYIQQLFIWPS